MANILKTLENIYFNNIIFKLFFNYPLNQLGFVVDYICKAGLVATDYNALI